VRFREVAMVAMVDARAGISKLDLANSGIAVP